MDTAKSLLRTQGEPWIPWPQDVYVIKLLGQLHVKCPDCGAPPGEKCPLPDTHTINTHPSRDALAALLPESTQFTR